MTTVLRVNLNDLSNQFIQDLRKRFDKTAQIEIRVEEQKQGEGLLSDEQFWQIIDCLDWTKQEPINKDGQSDRMKEQVNFLNRIDKWQRYFAQILIFILQNKSL